jgi:hypothetical protein
LWQSLLLEEGPVQGTPTGEHQLYAPQGQFPAGVAAAALGTLSQPWQVVLFMAST